MPPKAYFRPVLVALFFSVTGGSLEAQIWRTANGSAWTTAANWGGTIPTQDGAADLVFAQAGNPLLSQGASTMDVDWNVRSISWNVTALGSQSTVQLFQPSLSATTLTLQAGLNNGSGGRVEIYPDIILGALQTWNDTTTPTTPILSSAGTYLYGTLSGSGGIQKTGSGTLRLDSVTNSYSGATTVTGGVLEAGNAGSLGNASSALELNGGALRFAAFPLSTITVALNRDLVLGASGATLQTRSGELTLGGTISGVGALRVEPDPSWPSFTQSRYILTGANSYAGGTTLGAVTVTLLGTGQSLGTGKVTVQSGGVLALSASSNLGPGQKVALEAGAVLVINDATMNPANLISSNPSETTGGILSLGVDYGTALDLASIGNGQLSLGSTGAVSYTATTLGAGMGGVYRLGGGSGANQAGAPASILTLSGTDNLLTGSRSVVIGTTSLFQTSDAKGHSKVVLQNANDYSGGTTVVGGTLALGHNEALGSGAVMLQSGSVQSAGGARVIANPLVFSGPAGARFAFDGASNLTFAGPIDLGGTLHLVSSTTPRTTLSNSISNGSLTLVGGLWSLAATNSFAGGLTLSNNATLDFSSDNNLGAPGANLIFQSGLLRAESSVSTSRPVSVTASGGVIDTNGHTLVLSGAVTGGGPLRKTGAGTLIFSGNNIVSATVAQGTLLLDGNGPNGGWSAVVQNGATFGGNGTVGFTNVQAGAHLAPGLSTPGSLLFNSALTLNPGSSLDFDLGSTLFDQINFNHGAVTKGSVGTGPILVNIRDAGGLAAGQFYTLMDWTLGSESLIKAADFQLASSPVPGSFSVVGKTLQFATIPEPGSLGSMVVGMCLLLGARRRRALARVNPAG